MNKLSRILLLVVAALVLLALAFHESNPGLRMDRLGFHVNDGDALYFRNMRQFYYHKTLEERSGFDVFRLKASEVDSNSLHLGFAILNDWRNDQAYIMIEATEQTVSNDTIYFQARSGVNDWRMKLGPESMQRHLEIAAELYGWLRQSDAVFTVTSKGSEVEIWETRQERDNALRILKDYFKLTGTLR